MSSLITFLSCPFNLTRSPSWAPDFTRNCWCTIETSSDLLRSSSAIFWKCSELFEKCSEPFVWPSEQIWKIFGKWSEIFGKLSKTASSARLHYTLARRFYVLVVHSLVRYSSCHSNMKFISSCHRVISSMTEQCPITCPIWR